MTAIFPATQERLARWKEQPEVLGVLLVGSKSRAYNDELSDDDLEVLLTDEAFAALKPAECGEFFVDGEGEQRRMIYDIQYEALTSLQHKLSSTHDLDRWPYEKAPILFDRDGSLAPLVASLGSMDAEFRRLRLLHAAIDCWTGAARARKTFSRGFEAGGRLLIARSAKAMARLLFALEWRWMPMDHWLEKELATLSDPTNAASHLIEAVKQNDPTLLLRTLEGLQERLESEGVPPRSQWIDLFFELVHPGRAQERAIHGLV